MLIGGTKIIMKHKKLLTIFCIVALLWSTTAPALANSATDPIGAATTIFQLYLTEGAQGELRLNTNVAGKSPDAENYMDTALNLSTRLMPFSLDASMQYYANTNPTTFFVKFRGREYNDLNSQVRNKAKEIVADAQMYTTDYEKLRYINNYIIDNCEYVSAAVKNPEQYHTAFTIYGCLGEGKAVCEGYANTVQLLCEMMQIPCIKVTGTAYGGNHIWNAVYLNDKWWMLDVTFNDPVGLQDSSDRWSYFLLDLDTFQQKGTHTYDKAHYEHSKEIYTGRTTGQKSVSLPFSNLSMQNSVSGDIPDPRYLTDIGAVTATPEQPDKQQPSDHQSTDTTAAEKATEAKAQALKEQGLFMGDENGFRLKDSITRIEMGVMVMRMNGGLTAIKENSSYYESACPFTDVPQWARSSIGYLYDKKLAAGQTATTFGTGAVTKQDYAVMMLRVLQIEHSYQDALAIAVTHGILTEEQASNRTAATRGDIVDMTYATLQLMNEQQQQSAAKEENAA